MFIIFKKAAKKAIVSILEVQSRMILKKYQPEIIAITGSVGKTSTKEAIFAVLKNKFLVSKSEKSYNSEVGVPLTLFGSSNAWYSPFGWLQLILKGLGLILKKTVYPSKIILELGADRPGDIARFTRYVKPKIGVVTAIGEVPAHVEYFAGPEELAREKANLINSLSPSGWAVLNSDDYAVLEMKSETKAQVRTFGFGQDADFRASEYKLMFKEASPEGITFKLDHAGSSVPIRIFGSFGKQSVYAALAAAAVGIIYGMNLVEISEALSLYSGPPGRLKLIEGEKGTWILDDTYNASPQATHAAIDVLRDLPARRKIAVLGDMLELGKFTIQAHEKLGDGLKDVADVVITCGPRAKFIAEELKARRFGVKNLISVSDSYEAGKELEKIIEPGDLILIKGSQAMRMERAVEEIMAHPEKKSELLVRQEPEWLNKS